MTNMHAPKIEEILKGCDEEERRALFDTLRANYQIHALEEVFRAPAEVILEAIHRAPELTRRMLRGVVADAAFAQTTVPMLASAGWRDVTPEGNHAYDHMLQDATGPITVQVKLQRSAQQVPVVTTGRSMGFSRGLFVVETQRTRGGKKRGSSTAPGPTENTRPYRFGDFDVLAVSLQPSTGDWNSFLYTVGNWLLPGTNPGDIATYQPVAAGPNGDWTDDFAQAAAWVRSGVQKRISI